MILQFKTARNMNGNRRYLAINTAADFVAAITTIAAKPENLANLESYLNNHFAEWLNKYASTPDELAAEMKEFANMII